MILAIMLAIFFVLLFAGAPVFVAIGISSVVAALMSGTPETMVLTRLFGGLDKYSIMALPFYIYAANIMGIGGLSEKIVDWATALVRKVVGGIAVATEIACMAFGALSGSAPATVVAIGKIMTPKLEKQGYDKGFISGLITSSGAVAIIIPPSITMMMYASATGSSTGSLFIGGFIPGIIFGAATIAYCMFYAKKHNIGAVKNVDEEELTLGAATRKAAWALGVPVIIIGGIYGGFVTPTEAAGVSVVYALFVGAVIYKKIKLKEFWEITKKSVETSAQVMILIAVASIFAWMMTTMRVPQKLAEFAQQAASQTLFLLLMNVVLLIAGMLMDPNSLVIILGPIFYTIGTTLGLDPIHIGIIITVNLAIGMYTPPFGLNLFVASSVTGGTMAQIYKSVIPFILISIFALLLITFIPALTTFLPSLLY